MEGPQASMSKKIVMITTEHSIQQDDYSPRGEFRNIVLYLISIFSPKSIMEEWRSDGDSTIGRRVADEKLAGAWHGISPTVDLNLSWHEYRNLDGLMLREYGPIPLQTAREQYMLDRVQEVTSDSQTALFTTVRLNVEENQLVNVFGEFCVCIGSLKSA
jgi:hypothetical protein